MPRGVESITESQLIEVLHARLQEEVDNNGSAAAITKAQTKTVIKALKEEIAFCLANGYKVSFSGLLTITPSAKKGRKKGTKVRNPFDGTVKTLRSDEPDKFVVKAKVSRSVLDYFPEPGTSDGDQLVKQLMPKRKRRARVAA